MLYSTLLNINIIKLTVIWYIFKIKRHTLKILRKALNISLKIRLRSTIKDNSVMYERN